MHQVESDSKVASWDDPTEPKAALPMWKLAEMDAERVPQYTSPAATGMNSGQTRPTMLPPGDVAPIYVPPRPLRQVLPNPKPWIIASALEIEVEVKLDKDGHVETARLLKHANVPLNLAGAALAAAKQWTFKPAMLRTMRVESDYIIVFQIRPASP